MGPIGNSSVLLRLKFRCVVCTQKSKVNTPHAVAEELMLICPEDVVKCRLINSQPLPLSNDPAEEFKIRHMFCYQKLLTK